MGFDAEHAIIESTSFKTKFLDYLSFQKPILLWGTPYCSAVVTAKEFHSAEICTSPQVGDFIQSILKLKNDPAYEEQLITNAYKMYQERFNPDKLHKLLMTKIKAI